MAAEGRTLLAAAVCKGSPANAGSIVWALADTNTGYSRWFPAAIFLPAAGECYMPSLL